MMEGETGSETGESAAYLEADMNNSDIYDYEPCGYFAMDAPEIQAGAFMRMYIFPIVLFMGLLWNPLTAGALYYIGVHKWSTAFYLSLLSVVDLLILLIRAGDIWYLQIAERSLSAQIMNASDALCKTYHFIFMFMKHMSPWLVVAVSMELMISTTWPRKTYVVCTMERARNVLMLLVILIFCLDINHFWTWGVPRPDVGCTYTEEFSTEFRDMIWPMLTNTVELLLPLLFVSTCFFITAGTMINRKSSDEKNLEEELTKYFMELKTIKEFRVICLIICVIFMCLTLFKLALLVVEFLFVKGHLILDCDGQASFKLSVGLMRHLHMVFMFIFYTLKPIPYLVYSSTFRQTLKDGFLWCKRTVISLYRKMSRSGRKNRKDMWKSNNSKLGSNCSVNDSSVRGGGGGAASGGDIDGDSCQQLKLLVNDSNHSNSHRLLDSIDDDIMESNYTTGDNGSISGNGFRGRTSRSSNGGTDNNRMAVTAAVENHSVDDSRTSFLSTGTDV